MDAVLSSHVFVEPIASPTNFLIAVLLVCSLFFLLLWNYTRIAAHRRSEQQMRFHKVLWDLSKQEFHSTQPAFREMTRAVADLLQVNRVSIWLYNEDRTAVVCEEFFGAADHPLQVGAHIPIRENSEFLTLLEEEKTIVFRSGGDDSRFSNPAPHMLANRKRSAAIITLIWHGGKPQGILSIADLEKKRRWSPEEINLAVGAADLISLVLESVEKRKAEEALAVEASLLRALMESSADSIYFKDRDSRFLRVNQGFYEMHGIDPSVELRGKTDHFFHTQDFAERVFADEQRMMAQGTAIKNRIEEFARQGKDRQWVSTTKVPLRAGDGQVQGIVGISRDVTSSKMQEMKLRQFIQAIEQSSAIVVITDLSGAIQYVNPKFSEVTGYSLDEALGKNPRILKSGETPAVEYERLWRTISSGGEWAGEFHNRRKDGSLYWERALISALTDAENQITGYIAIKEDISEEKHLRDALAASQKFATIGNLAAGIAHEINTPIQLVVGMSDSLLRRLRENTPDAALSQRYLDTIRRNGLHVAEIVRSLLTYARTPESTFSRTDLNEIIQDSLLLVEHQLLSWSNITVITDLDARRPQITCDREKIIQVIINLLTNARDAMPNGGTIAITTNTDGDPSSVDLSIRDQGAGIPPEVLDRMFDPFFTTKPTGEGTGLGLSIVHGIVETHGGKISVASRPGQGTTFTLTFPLSHVSDEAGDGRTAGGAATSQPSINIQPN